MKNILKTILLLVAIITAGKQYAQGLPFIPIPCSKLVPTNTDRETNVEIAKACKEIWDTKRGLGLLGPFGKYVRHIYKDETSIQKNEFGIITGMRVYVTAIVQKGNGKLKVAYVVFDREYMGGGQYGKIKNGYVSGDIRNTKHNCVENLPDWIGLGPVAKKADKTEVAEGATDKPAENKDSK